MPITRNDIPYLSTAGMRAEFFAAFKASSENIRDYEKIATIIPSSKKQETYAWLGDIPSFREFLSERQIRELIETGYTIVNKKWELTIAVEADAFSDDQYGQLQVRVRAMGQEAPRHKNALVFETLGKGFTSKCYDGQYFFDTDHSEGNSGTQSNKGTDALSHAAVLAARLAMRKFKNDQGKYLGIEPNVCVCSADEADLAHEIFDNEYLSITESNKNERRKNPLYGQFTIIVSPDFVSGAGASGGGSWCLLDTTKALKPMILQEREAVSFNMLDLNSDTGFMRDEYVYGAKARYNAGYGIWQCAYGNLVA